MGILAVVIAAAIIGFFGYREQKKRADKAEGRLVTAEAERDALKERVKELLDERREKAHEECSARNKKNQAIWSLQKDNRKLSRICEELKAHIKSACDFVNTAMPEPGSSPEGPQPEGLREQMIDAITKEGYGHFTELEMPN